MIQKPIVMTEGDTQNAIVVGPHPSEDGFMVMGINTKIPDGPEKERLLRCTIDLAVDELIALDRRLRAKRTRR